MQKLASGLYVPEENPPKATVYTLDSPPDWGRFLGNNHERIETNGSMCGSLSFREHLGQPLTKRLWEDLMFRLRITGLCIYGRDSEQWTIGWGAGHCSITFAADGFVRDIEIVPR